MIYFQQEIFPEFVCNRRRKDFKFTEVHFHSYNIRRFNSKTYDNSLSFVPKEFTLDHNNTISSSFGNPQYPSTRTITRLRPSVLELSINKIKDTSNVSICIYNIFMCIFISICTFFFFIFFRLYLMTKKLFGWEYLTNQQNLQHNQQIPPLMTLPSLGSLGLQKFCRLRISTIFSAI